MHTPKPWVPWFGAPDLDGFITQAGVDTADRVAGICELLTENIEFDDREQWNDRVKADVRLLAAAPELLDLLERVLSVDTDDDGDTILPASFLDAVRDIVAKAKGGDMRLQRGDLTAAVDRAEKLAAVVADIGPGCVTTYRGAALAVFDGCVAQSGTGSMRGVAEYHSGSLGYLRVRWPDGIEGVIHAVSTDQSLCFTHKAWRSVDAKIRPDRILEIV